MDFSVITYNIHKGIGNDRLYNINRVIDICKDLNPDILALQEVDHSVPRSRYDDQASIFSEKLGYHVILGLNVKLKKGFYGNAVLSRYPIAHHSNINLTWTIKKPRACLSTILDIHGKKIAFMNYHLGLAGIERTRQVKMILSSPFHQQHKTLPVIILGDSNDRSHRLNPLLQKAGYSDTCKDANIKTFPSFAPVWRLDKIYYNRHFLLKEHMVVENKFTRLASDHLPVFAKFRINNVH